MGSSELSRPSERIGVVADKVASFLEAVIYVGVSLALVVGAGALLADAIFAYVGHLSDGVPAATIELLSALLLVFVFVELLGATRVTIREQRLIAEPFLLVGIIAAIKEIVIVAGAEASTPKSFDTFRNGMAEVIVLSGVVLVLSISALLLRKRSQEPAEESNTTV